MQPGGAQARKLEKWARETLPGIIAVASLAPAPSNSPKDIALHTRIGEIQGTFIKVKAFVTFTGDDDATVALSTPDPYLEREMKRAMLDHGYVLQERLTCRGNEVGPASQRQIFWRYYFRHTQLAVVSKIHQYIPKGITP